MSERHAEAVLAATADRAYAEPAQHRVGLYCAPVRPRGAGITLGLQQDAAGLDPESLSLRADRQLEVEREALGVRVAHQGEATVGGAQRGGKGGRWCNAVGLVELMLEERERRIGERAVLLHRKLQPALDGLTTPSLQLDLEEAHLACRVEAGAALEAFAPVLHVLAVQRQGRGVEVDGVVGKYARPVDLENEVVMPELADQPRERGLVEHVLALGPGGERCPLVDERELDRREPRGGRLRRHCGDVGQGGAPERLEEIGQLLLLRLPEVAHAILSGAAARPTPKAGG